MPVHSTHVDVSKPRSCQAYRPLLQSRGPGLTKISQVAHEFLLRKTDFTLRTLQTDEDLGITADMVARFRPLGRAIFGNDEARQENEDYL